MKQTTKSILLIFMITLFMHGFETNVYATEKTKNNGIYQIAVASDSNKVVEIGRK